MHTTRLAPTGCLPRGKVANLYMERWQIFRDLKGTLTEVEDLGLLKACPVVFRIETI